MSTAPPELADAAAALRAVPLFAGLDGTEIARIARAARHVTARRGDLIMAEGTPTDGLYIILRGELEIRRRAGAEEVFLGTRGAGELIGEWSILFDEPRSASVHAGTDAELLVVRPEEFAALAAASPQVLHAVLRGFAERLRATEAALMERGKLAALGQIAAGIAHELNNPAAAVSRGAAHVRAAMADIQQATLAVSALALTGAEAVRFDALAAEVDTCPPAAGDPVQRGLDEDGVAAWLADRGIEREWERATALAGFGWSRDRLDALAADFGGDRAAPIARWLAARLAARALTDEIERSATAIAGIVRAVKTYTWLDRGPVQHVDLADSLENTLTILAHRLRPGVDVIRDHAADMPPVEGYGGLLNQVWTNLIANAIDAMDGRGTLLLRTRLRGDRAVVEIIDDGPGIPAAVQARIFEPFFTTRAPGSGSGLGLAIAWNVVVNDHRGTIHFDTRPGRTRFCVSLPLRMPRLQPAARQRP